MNSTKDYARETVSMMIHAATDSEISITTDSWDNYCTLKIKAGQHEITVFITQEQRDALTIR